MISLNYLTEAMQKTILVIDNDPDWLETITNALGKGNESYNVICVKHRIDAIRELKENKIDLVFVNLLLRESFSGNWLDDFTRILDEISNQSGRAILITGVNKEDFTIMNTIVKLLRKYREILTLLPKGDISTSRIREVAMMGLEKGEVENNIVQEIMAMFHSGFPGKDFFSQYQNDIKMLVDSREDRKIFASVSLWNSLWLEEDGLPYIPLMRVLAQQEFSGTMYPGYRDHVSHSIWIYFLGLYLYLNNKPIRQAILSKFSVDQFFKAWKIASLFHDVGYAGDKGIDQEEIYLKPLLSDLNTLYSFPLSGYLTIRGIECSQTDEEEINKVVGNFIPKVFTLDNLEKLYLSGKEELVLNFIEDIVIPTQLAQPSQKTPLQNYYKLCKSIKPRNRERFRDHGILSALLLLHQFYHFDERVKNLKNVLLPTRLSRKATSMLEEIRSSPFTQLYEEPVKQAAAAIALHNVNVDIWDIEITKDEPYFLSLQDYKITLEEVPLAFLLALTDVLQCWDRPKRKYVDSLGDLSLPGQDVKLRCGGDVIFWSVKVDSTIKNQLIKPSQEIQNMSKYLSYTRDKSLEYLLQEEEWNE